MRGNDRVDKTGSEGREIGVDREIERDGDAEKYSEGVAERAVEGDIERLVEKEILRDSEKSEKEMTQEKG